MKAIQTSLIEKYTYCGNRNKLYQGNVIMFYKAYRLFLATIYFQQTVYDECVAR